MASGLRYAAQFDHTGRQSKVAGNVRDGSLVILDLLKTVARFTPVPFLEAAADTVLSILRVVSLAEENGERFLDLTQRAVQCFLTIASALEGVQADGRLLSNVRALESALFEILDLIKKEESRTYIARFLLAQKTVSRIRILEQQLQQVLSLFQIRSLISLQDLSNSHFSSLERIEAGITSLVGMISNKPRKNNERTQRHAKPRPTTTRRYEDTPEDYEVSLYDAAMTVMSEYGSDGNNSNIVGADPHEARHWHRRVYKKNKLHTLASTEIGYAAAYEAYQMWTKDTAIYASLTSDMDRQQQGLVGLAVAEASRLIQLCGREMDSGARMRAFEAAIATAKHLSSPMVSPPVISLPVIFPPVGDDHLGVGRHEARYWHRRAYAGKGNQMGPADIGHAAAYEAYRTWNLSHNRLSKNVDRQRLSEHAVGEASRLMHFFNASTDAHALSTAHSAAAATTRMLYRIHQDLPEEDKAVDLFPRGPRIVPDNPFVPPSSTGLKLTAQTSLPEQSSPKRLPTGSGIPLLNPLFVTPLMPMAGETRRQVRCLICTSRTTIYFSVAKKKEE